MVLVLIIFYNIIFVFIYLKHQKSYGLTEHTDKVIFIEGLPVPFYLFHAFCSGHFMYWHNYIKKQLIECQYYLQKTGGIFIFASSQFLGKKFAFKRFNK